MKPSRPAASASPSRRVRGQFIVHDLAQQSIELYFAIVMNRSVPQEAVKPVR